MILVKVWCNVSGVTASELALFLRKFYSRLSKRAIIRRVHRALDRLEDEGLVETEVMGSYRFARLTLAGLRAIPAAVDLIRSVIGTKPPCGGCSSAVNDSVNDIKGPLKEVPLRRGQKKALEGLLERVEEKEGLLSLIPDYRASKDWWVIARDLYTKSLEELTEFDKERLGLTFEAWKDEVKENVLVFLDENGDLVVLPYRTRFTDERYVRELIWKYNVAWDVATFMFDVAVFVTITLPPIFPLPIAKMILGFLKHRLKADLRKRYGRELLFSDEVKEIYERYSEEELENLFKEAKKAVVGGEGVSEGLRRFMEELGIEDVRGAERVLECLVKFRKVKTPPHISSVEPQDSLAPHLHMIIFGITRIKDKRELTRWLDGMVENFLESMGDHVKSTLNNKLPEGRVRWLNKYGKKLLKKYQRYKKKRKGYRGPVNWVTQLKRNEIWVEVNGKRVRKYYWEFANPPPDYVKFLERVMKKRVKEEGCEFRLDRFGGPADYVKKYLIKNLKEIVDEGLRNARDVKEIKKSNERKLWEAVGEALKEMLKKKAEGSKGKEGEVELKMVDDTSKRTKKRKKKRRRRGSSWGSKVKFEEDGKRKRLKSSIKMGWYWLTRERFYSVSPVFRVWGGREKRQSRRGWEFVGVKDRKDLEMWVWLESRVGRSVEIIWLD